VDALDTLQRHHVLDRGVGQADKGELAHDQQHRQDRATSGPRRLVSWARNPKATSALETVLR